MFKTSLRSTICLHNPAERFKQKRVIFAEGLACGGEALTLVIDEAVGGEQFEGVDLEQDSVEQKVVSSGTELGFVAQTGLGEFLKGKQSDSQSSFKPHKCRRWFTEHPCGLNFLACFYRHVHYKAALACGLK